MTDLFLSYKAEDRARVAPIVEALEADGYSVWWDADIAGGDDWRATISRYLDAARCVIVVWSKRSVGPGGHFVRDEATRALRRGVYLPIKIDSVAPPLGFGETQALNLRGWKGDREHAQYQALSGAVRARLGHVPQSTSQPGRRGFSRRAVILGSTTAAAAGIGGWAVFRSGKGGDDSIAVLPFANLSGDPHQAYFSDGIAEELRTVLSRIPGLKVVARTSSEAVRNADAKTAASKLRVENVLTGSVRRSSSMLRISAQLVDGADGTERWSDVYDRAAGDALQIQSEIANMVAQALSLRLNADEQRALVEGGTRIAEAQDLLLQARSIIWHKDDRASFNRARGLIDRALSLDPEYANALAARASILGMLGGQLATSTRDMEAKYALAEMDARNAIRIAPRSAQAYATLGRLSTLRLQLREALVAFENMEKQPGTTSSDFDGPDPYSTTLAQCLRFGQALARTDRLIALDPLNPYTYMSKATVLGQARRYAEAEEIMRQSIELAPDLIWPRGFHAFYVMQMGRTAQAAAEFAALGGGGPWLAWAAAAATRLGKDDEAERLVQVMHKEMGDSANYQFAQVFAQQGRSEEALAALQTALDKRDPGLVFLQVDPMFDPIRANPRFVAIVKQIDFPT